MVVRVECFFVTQAMHGSENGVILCFSGHAWL